MNDGRPGRRSSDDLNVMEVATTEQRCPTHAKALCRLGGMAPRRGLEPLLPT